MHGNRKRRRVLIPVPSPESQPAPPQRSENNTTQRGTNHLSSRRAAVAQPGTRGGFEFVISDQQQVI